MTGPFSHGIHRSADERKRHLGELQRTQVAAGYPAQFNFLYQSLGILDSKASALLTFNGITLAALAIWMEGSAKGGQHMLLDAAFLLSLVSSGFCLSVNWIRWESTDELADEQAHAVTLLALRDSRTRHYRSAWLLAALSVVLVFLVTLWHVNDMRAQGWVHAESGCRCDAPPQAPPLDK